VAGLAWALRAARPIVTSTVPDTCEVLAGCDARFCAPGSSQDAARAIVETLEEPPGEAALASGVERAAALFDMDRIVTTYRQQYMSLSRCCSPTLVCGEL